MNAPALVHLNVDLGERDGEPAELYALATAVNVACGGHAGDDASMARAVELAIAAGARLGAHPSYPDRERFGRVALDLEPSALYTTVAAQCASLAAVARAHGARVEHVKLHGALYHDASRRADVAAAALDAAVSALPDAPIVVGEPDSALARAALARGLRYEREGFADRRYDAAGQLVARGTPGALLAPHEAATQAAALAATAAFDTLCVHGDSDDALAVARAVRAALGERAARGGRA